MKMKKNIWWLCILAFCLLRFDLRAQERIGVSVGVLPFEIFGGAKPSSLGDECSKMLSQLLDKNPAIHAIDQDQIQSVLAQDTVTGLTPDRLKQIAKLLNANFLVFGSITMVREEISIDAQVYYNFPGDAYFKTYAEGTDKQAVLTEIARKIEQEIIDKADMVPPAQRTKISGTKISSPQSAGQKLDYELYVERALESEKRTESREMVGISKAAQGAEQPEESDLTRKSVEDVPGPKIDTAAVKKTDLSDAQDVREPAVKSPVTALGGVAMDKPVNITADTLEYDNKSNSAVFRGNVVARQNDIVLFADEVSVVYARSDEKEAGKGRMKQLTAQGNVKVIQGERIATGQKIVFYNDEQKIVATGNPRVWQGDNVITGNKITVFLKEDRSVVEGSLQERVSATIYPKEKKTQKR